MKLMKAQEAKFVQAKLQGKNNSQAAIYAGYAPTSARQRGHELMKRAHIREALGITLYQLGITFDKAVKPIAAALQATKLIVHNGANENEGWTEEIADHPTRLKAAAMALKLITDEDTTQLEKPHVAQYGSPLSEADARALQSMDEVELQKVIFRKHDD